MNETATPTLERPARARRTETAATPATFRRQEAFWNEVRRRIAERNPRAEREEERLY